MLNNEPPIAADDTKPVPPTGTRPDRPVIRRAKLETVYDTYTDFEEKPRGCGQSLFVIVMVGGAFLMFVAIVGLAGLAGYRDGVNDKSTQEARTRVAVLNTQQAAISIDQQNGNWELVLSRCQYVLTLVPGDVGAQSCVEQAVTAIAAATTPPPVGTPAPDATLPINAPTQSPAVIPNNPTPPIITPTPQATADPLATLLIQAKAQIAEGKTENLETAREMLEAIRSQDKTYSQREVESQLCTIYETLGSTYNLERRLSEMVIVINKGLTMQCRFGRKDWSFTVDAAQLYLSASAYSAAGNLPQAARVYRLMFQRGMEYYQNTKELACGVFRQANDSGAVSQYCN